MGRVSDCARSGRYDCYYEVPAVTQGLPLYDGRVMRNTLLAYLVERGWEAVALGERGLQVRWKPTGAAKAPRPPKAAPGGLSQATHDRISRLLGRSSTCKEKK